MNATIKHISFILLCLLYVCTACRKDEIPVYNGEDRVNIDYASMPFDKDTVRIAYGFVAAQKEIVELKLLLMGYAKDHDREVGLTITSKDGAVAGTHYELPAKIVIPKGEVQTIVPLTVLRPTDLAQNGPRSFLLQIVDSKELKAGIQTTLFVSVSDDIPDTWVGDAKWFMNKISLYFGECSKTKYMFIYNQFNVWDFSSWSIYGMMGDAKKFLPAKRILKERLAAYETEHGLLVDPVKGRVTFPD